MKEYPENFDELVDALMSQVRALLNDLCCFADSSQYKDLEKSYDDLWNTLCRRCKTGDRAKQPCWRPGCKEYFE